jgi:photosystem II stability/assembly factor-like uncharacterized protein
LSIPRLTLITIALASLALPQSIDPKLYSEMHWRSIGPPRAGRARALAGVPSQPNVFYIGFDNGGVWRSSDFGSTWVPLFDDQPTGSIGAIAVAPSNPNIIYVGSGAGIIRPDLATGDGFYKSTDAGKTWTHTQALRDSQMIADIEVDPGNPNRLFVAVLGHPYGPNTERGIFRSTNGGLTFEKVLYKDEYTSGNDVRIDPKDPNTIYAALWQQQQGFFENGSFGGTDGGIFKSTDGGTTWKQLTNGLPPILEANLAVAPSNSKVIYATVAPGGPAPGAAAGGRGGGRGGRGGGGAAISFYKSTDAGEHWFLATDDPRVSEMGSQRHPPDARPLGRIGGGDLPTITVDPSNENVVYSCSTVFWRTEDGGLTWSAVRGAPGGDDYQKSWVNPVFPQVILLVSDQGGVVSSNRGESWSNWYNQPTAAMYHVTADNAFPYRLCSGQQDSGSACVESRSMDGEITFHDWHPVGIEEYGEAAPDPRNPDLVYGGKVTVYNRLTGQKANVGPPGGGRGGAVVELPPGAPPGRTVRTQPLNWSPKDPTVLFYATAGVWKTTNAGHSWTPISGDLTRQNWDVPTNAGKYVSTVTPAAQGSVTALAPSPLDVNVLWAGTGDGLIQVTMDGGKKWTNVTPSQMKPWTRIFNMDAGHFDSKTAYAAANTLRLDDMNPHLWRTHDGGKTWTEIDKGIDGGAVTNSIREDPRKKGLLYASTDTQVWVSFDDGDNWHSLRLNMPAISIRDIEVKDDASCMCSDLVAGTHGRGFWILDDVTPLRQAAEAAAATSAYLFKPATGIRIRFGTNDPTPWPPELPAGENPPAGAIVDYYLPSSAGEVKLEFLSTQGKVIRTYSSTDKVMSPDPATDPVAYNKICQQTPTAPDCGLPLYWPAPQQVLKATAGMHRFTWDMHYDPLPGGGGGGRGGGGGANGAVPHRTYPGVNSPWVAPGTYSVRLTANGQTLTQPIIIKLDPRVKITPEVQQIFTLTTKMEDNAGKALAAYKDAREQVVKLKARPQSAENDALIKKVEDIAPAEAAPSGGGRGGRGGGGGGGGLAAAAEPPAPPNLSNIAAQMIAAVQGMQAAEMPPTATELQACAKAETAYAALMAKWSALKLSCCSAAK